MRSPQLMKTPRRSVSSKGLFAAWSIVICVGSVGVVTQSQAQQLLPADRAGDRRSGAPILDPAKVSSPALHERDLLAVFQRYPGILS